ncbi:hypothetical protein BKA93DRAFT_826303 [Sparassis latifolia]
MYLTDGVSESGTYESPSKYSSNQWSVRRPPAPPTSIPLDDGFDAVTTEVPTEWNIGAVRHRDYEESVSGYRNYVLDMERKLSGEDDYYVSSEKTFDNTKRSELTYTGSMRTLKKSSLNMPIPENARKISGNRGKIELVEQKVIEDNPQRTISLWRERVAQSSGGSNSRYDDADDLRSDHTNSHAHRRVLSDDSRMRRVASHGRTGSGGTSAHPKVTGREMEVRRSGRASYERSEYMVTYAQPSRNGFPMAFYAQSELGNAIPLKNKGSQSNSSNAMVNKPLPDRSISSGNRRSSGRHSNERNEYMITYAQTSPFGSGSTTRTPSLRGQRTITMTPLQKKSFIPAHPTDASTLTKATSTSSVELILSSCDPSLLHIASILSDLGIQRLEHLRAIARLSEETRDKEIKEQALKRGVTVVEWAILLDKLQSL